MRVAAVIFSAVLFLTGIPAYAQHGGGHGGGGHSGGGHSGGGATGASRGGGASHAGGQASGHAGAHAVIPPHSSPAGAASHHETSLSPAYIVARPSAERSNTRLDTGRVFFSPSPAPGEIAVTTRNRFPVARVPHGFIGRRPLFQLPRGAIVVGNGFFCDPFTTQLFFFDPFFFEQFGPNVFCPFCAFGRVNPLLPTGFFFARQGFFSPFRHRLFFGGGFFDGFGFDPFLFDGLNQVPQQEQFNDADSVAAATAESFASEGFEAPPAAANPDMPAKLQTLSLLVLKDGSIYAVTDYWLEGDRLHYITNYHGENSIPLDQLDLQTTAQMNFERGNSFVLHPAQPERQKPN